MVASLHSQAGSIESVWVKESGREALIKFTYKDSAKRVLAAHSHSKEF